MKNLLPDSILVCLLAKVASRFLDELVTTRASFKNAKIITDVLLTRKIEQLVRHVGFENV